LSREWRLCLGDMVEHPRYVEQFTADITRDEFLTNLENIFAVQRAFEIVGEAAKQIPDRVRARHPRVDWRGVAGFRDVLAHAYHRVDGVIVWDLAVNKVPMLREELEAALQAESVDIPGAS
jgi:uncharacterized protein with HEPN domain